MKCHAPDLVSVVRGVPDALTAFATRASKPVHFPSKMAAIILNETHVTIPTQIVFVSVIPLVIMDMAALA